MEHGTGSKTCCHQSRRTEQGDRPKIIESYCTQWYTGEIPEYSDVICRSGSGSGKECVPDIADGPGKECGSRYEARHGLTANIHAVVVDGMGNSLHILRSHGNVDITMAKQLLEPFSLDGVSVICDSGYDSDKLAACIVSADGQMVVPGCCTATFPRDTVWHLYKERHLVEYLF